MHDVLTVAKALRPFFLGDSSSSSPSETGLALRTLSFGFAGTFFTGLAGRALALIGGEPS